MSSPFDTQPTHFLLATLLSLHHILFMLLIQASPPSTPYCFISYLAQQSHLSLSLSSHEPNTIRRIYWTRNFSAECEEGIMYPCSHIGLSKSWGGLWWLQYLPSLCLQDDLLREVEPSWEWWRDLWGAYIFKRNVIAMSFAPRDNHEAQVQFILEKGVPAIISVLGTIKLPYPSRAFDMAHCSRCLIPWDANDGIYMMEVDRVLRPCGY